MIYICSPRPGVEIGRQATLRWWYSKGCAGSNPVSGTLRGNSFIRVAFVIY